MINIINTLWKQRFSTTTIKWNANKRNCVYFSILVKMKIYCIFVIQINNQQIINKILLNTTIWNEFPLWTFLSDDRKCIFKMKMLRNSFLCVFLFSHKIWEIKHFFIQEKCVFFNFSKFFFAPNLNAQIEAFRTFFFEFSEKSSIIFYNLLKHS